MPVIGTGTTVKITGTATNTIGTMLISNGILMPGGIAVTVVGMDIIIVMATLSGRMLYQDTNSVSFMELRDGRP